MTRWAVCGKSRPLPEARKIAIVSIESREQGVPKS
jgi:hypothetical protein